MTYYEELIKAGLTEEQAKAANELHKKALEETVPKHRLNEEIESRKQAEKTIDERDKQIEGLKGFEGTNESLQGEIEKLTQANEQDAKDYTARINKLEKTNAIIADLMGRKENRPHNANMVLTNIDYEAIEVKDGKVVKGLDDQVDALVKSDSYLFETTKVDTDPGKPNPAGIKIVGKDPGTGAGGDGDPKEGAEATSFGQQMAQRALASRGITPKNEGGN